jgi:predicted dehydrogenase
MRYARKCDEGFRYFKPIESWFPDAFSATMGQLLIAIETDHIPAVSGRDNLKTIALVEAAVLSAIEHRTVRPEDIVMTSAQ